MLHFNDLFIYVLTLQPSGYSTKISQVKEDNN